MVKIAEQIIDKVRLLPKEPGVYLWKNKDSEVIYVGKAANLYNRIKSYLADTEKDQKTKLLLSQIADLEYIIVNSENEAFILEATLIKKHQPKYNILLKDDKRYPFIKVTVQEYFPRIIVTREIHKDGSKYFGPFTDAKSLRRTLHLLEWVFPLRTCNRYISLNKVSYKKSCINYQLHKCFAPCIGNITEADYSKIVSQLLDFFQGKYHNIINELRLEMNKASEELRFEEAAKLRDRIKEIEKIQNRQSVYLTDQKNIDVIGLYHEENVAIVIVLHMINGKILHQENYPLLQFENSSSEEIMGAFLKLYYMNKDVYPEKILLSHQPDELEGLNKWLKNRLELPQRGDKAKLVIMAKRNAFHLAEEKKLAYLRKANRTIFPIQELKERLDLPKLPRKIVCMDISTIQGSDTVASAVYFENGKPKKKYYRHYIIRSISTQNDFAAISETMCRFLKETDDNTDMLPDLFIIDGGKGQLNAAFEVLQINNKHIPIISIAKRVEEIFLPDKSESVLLAKSSSALRMIIKIRDEAHRIAINFHRTRRTKRTLTSELITIPGVGINTMFLLLKQFGSIENIRKCSIEQLCNIKKIGKVTAQKILNYLNNNFSLHH